MELRNNSLLNQRSFSFLEHICTNSVNCDAFFHLDVLFSITNHALPPSTSRCRARSSKLRCREEFWKCPRKRFGATAKAWQEPEIDAQTTYLRDDGSSSVPAEHFVLSLVRSTSDDLIQASPNRVGCLPRLHNSHQRFLKKKKSHQRSSRARTLPASMETLGFLQWWSCDLLCSSATAADCTSRPYLCSFVTNRTDLNTGRDREHTRAIACSPSTCTTYAPQRELEHAHDNAHDMTRTGRRPTDLLSGMQKVCKCNGVIPELSLDTDEHKEGRTWSKSNDQESC
jgi:hypothetical protein